LKVKSRRQPLHRHCERSEAIQGPQHCAPDCFGAARLAMTSSRKVLELDFITR
jgi:hypothetical protein